MSTGMSLLTALVALIVLLLVPPVRRRLGDLARDLSDVLVSGFLRRTSQFGSDLNREGREEQDLWRSQRLRYFRGFDEDDSQP